MLDELSLEDLDGDQRELADAIGIDAYRALVRRFGGCTVYVCKADTVLKTLRDKRINREFNGANYRYLAQKYDMSERMIREIVVNNIRKGRYHIPGQLSLFGD